MKYTDEIKNTLKFLDELEGLAFENEDDFIKTFIGESCMTDLLGVSFSNENVEFRYVVDTGQTIVSSVKMNEFLLWTNAYITVYKEAPGPEDFNRPENYSSKA